MKRIRSGKNYFFPSSSSCSSNCVRVSGGGIYNWKDCRVVNCTIAGNVASNGKGGGIFNRQDLVVRNSVLATNSAPQDDDLCNDLGYVEGACNLSSFGDWNGPCNYLYDENKPLFNDPQNGRYDLAENSQAVNCGSNAFVQSMTDLVDIGAYEYVMPILFQYDETNHEATMSWDPVPDALSYNVKISRDDGENWITYRKTKLPSTSLKGLYPGESYAFRVCPVDDDGKFFGSPLEAKFAPLAIKRKEKRAPSGRAAGERRYQMVQRDRRRTRRNRRAAQPEIIQSGKWRLSAARRRDRARKFSL